MKFIFIAVNYNGFRFTCDYISSVQSIRRDSSDLVETIIVDNGSKLEEYDRLKAHSEEMENVQLIRLDENIGYFRGLNVGISRVDKGDDVVLVVGNNDLTFDEDFIINYKAIDLMDDNLVVAPNITTKYGRQQNPHVIDRVGKMEKFKSKLYYSNYYVGQAFKILNSVLKKLLKTDTKNFVNNYGQMKIKRGIGACYILPPKFFQFFDKLDDHVFLWGEEVLLSSQVESVSGTTLYVPTLKIIHHESASVAKIASRKRYNINKASYQIYKKDL